EVTNRGRAIVRRRCLRIAPRGRSWAAATTEGLAYLATFGFAPGGYD
ncbi:hypothetical protein Tco_1150021, partial [Tanacetum coccineum]